MGYIYTMPSNLPFARTLAKGLLARCNYDPHKLAQIRLLLPTRRACRVVQAAFLRESHGQALLLPKLQPLGEADAQEMILSVPDPALADEFAALPRAIPEMKRRLLMAELIQERLKTPPTQSLKLAIELSSLLDQLYTENLSIEDLEKLAPDDIAQHWQITLDFLDIFKTAWPQKLAQLNMIDSIDRRNRLLQGWAKAWDKAPPKEFIIAAGMTGSIPVAANFLKVIKELDQSEIILPGLDLSLDNAAWEEIAPTHPQYGLYRLLSGLDASRDDVRIWPLCDTKEPNDIEILASEVMRPATSTLKWQNLKERFNPDDTQLKNITKIEAATPQEEAMSIALIMREIIEQPSETAHLITPDRNLARRVSEILKRWHIHVDDSAGTPLLKTPRGNFLMHVLQAGKHRAAPVALLSLLKHQYMGDKNAQNLRNEVRQLDIKHLRGIFTKSLLDQAADKSDLLAATLETLEAMWAQPHRSLKDWVDVHLKSAQTLATTKAKDGIQRLWSGEDGEALAGFFAELMQYADETKNYTISEYIDLLQLMAQTTAVRPKYGTHPRLAILGIMESRLSDADVVILSGLNEGSWPAAANEDPWLSRPMKKKIGLPTQEQQIGFSAHDFVQHFCAQKVVMTRCQKEAGALTVPARWLTRLDTVLHALDLTLNADSPYLDWAQQIDIWQGCISPATRPAPTPPAEIRPRELSVTNFEHWMGDPYAVYAKYILSLRKAEDLEKESDAALRGEIVHDVLHRYVADHLLSWPDSKTAANEMLKLAVTISQEKGIEQPQALAWWPRFENMLSEYAKLETDWREAGHKPAKLEHLGTTEINGFKITAKADRLDVLADGRVGIIDYKTARINSTAGVKNGHRPQLPLEALIQEDGGFSGIGKKEVSYMAFWELVGEEEKPVRQNEIKPDKETELADLLSDTRAGVSALIRVFQDAQTPYYALPNPDVMPVYRDYDHLSRFKEWADEDGGEDAA